MVVPIKVFILQLNLEKMAFYKQKYYDLDSVVVEETETGKFISSEIGTHPDHFISGSTKTENSLTLNVMAVFL